MVDAGPLSVCSLLHLSSACANILFQALILGTGFGSDDVSLTRSLVRSALCRCPITSRTCAEPSNAWYEHLPLPPNGTLSAHTKVVLMTTGFGIVEEI